MTVLLTLGVIAWVGGILYSLLWWYWYYKRGRYLSFDEPTHRDDMVTKEYVDRQGQKFDEVAKDISEFDADKPMWEQTFPGDRLQ